MAEIHSAEGSDGVIKQSDQSPATPKGSASSSSEKRSGSKATKKSAAPKVNERGVPITVWDNPDNDPNKRAHVGDDPTGESNKLK